IVLAHRDDHSHVGISFDFDGVSIKQHVDFSPDYDSHRNRSSNASSFGDSSRTDSACDLIELGVYGIKNRGGSYGGRMPIQVGKQRRVVQNVAIEVEALRIVDLSVGDGLNLRAPIRAQPAS